MLSELAPRIVINYTKIRTESIIIFVRPECKSYLSKNEKIHFPGPNNKIIIPYYKIPSLLLSSFDICGTWLPLTKCTFRVGIDNTPHIIKIDDTIEFDKYAFSNYNPPPMTVSGYFPRYDRKNSLEKVIDLNMTMYLPLDIEDEESKKFYDFIKSIDTKFDSARESSFGESFENYQYFPLIDTKDYLTMKFIQRSEEKETLRLKVRLIDGETITEQMVCCLDDFRACLNSKYKIKPYFAIRQRWNNVYKNVSSKKFMYGLSMKLVMVDIMIVH